VLNVQFAKIKGIFMTAGHYFLLKLEDQVAIFSEPRGEMAEVLTEMAENVKIWS
jgi:hypothetical protein